LQFLLLACAEWPIIFAIIYFGSWEGVWKVGGYCQTAEICAMNNSRRTVIASSLRPSLLVTTMCGTCEKLLCSKDSATLNFGGDADMTT